MARVTSEAMILAGGLGTRLRAMVADRPKPMAAVGGRPFIAFLLDQLVRHGFQRVVICVGHMGQYVPKVLGDHFGPLRLVYSFEEAPLGTGGALRLASSLVSENDVLAMNGDSFCDFNLCALSQAHRSYGAAATLAVLEQSDRRRSGAVTIDSNGHVTGFESRPAIPTPGLINAGVYMFRRNVLDFMPQGLNLSLEDDVFSRLISRGELFALQVNGRFIDIGTPESYDAVQTFF
jgi:D-glycero-alpha-D-manno-heptose 1-phosphate guanylyltransferase